MPKYRTLILQVLRNKINIQVGHESEDEELDREAIRDSSDEETDDCESTDSTTVGPKPSTVSISNLKYTTEFRANAIQPLSRIHGDSAVVAPDRRCSPRGEDTAPEIDQEEDFPDIIRIVPVSKDSTQILDETLVSNTRAKNPTMSLLTQGGIESSSVTPLNTIYY